ncbi:MAG: hypothetical protein AVDCRST_MAG79-2748, partial [uncultured Thermoleophilia bacterium]
ECRRPARRDPHAHRSRTDGSDRLDRGGDRRVRGRRHQRGRVVRHPHRSVAVPDLRRGVRVGDGRPLRHRRARARRPADDRGQVHGDRSERQDQGVRRHAARDVDLPVARAGATGARPEAGREVGPL